tara:strand:- start:565 stop:1047 length:483 start_codon:yes stop_codon:yes gene_type:complete
MVIIKKGTILYHGTIHDFEPDEMKTPGWFSTLKEQAHNHVCYKYYGYNHGRLLLYRLKQDISVIDLSRCGSSRLFVNAYGNYALADNIKKERRYEGYINFPEQSEVMIIDANNLEFIEEEKIKLNKKVVYIEIANKNVWRMMEESNEVIVKHNTRCCNIM